MSTLFVHHKVEDYTKWRPVFDEMGAVRKAHGASGWRVLRDAANPNELIILTEFPNPDSARRYAQAPELRDAMQRAGVSGRPEVLFLDEA
jgi:heme-degrading monooxygenase HmoA